jgi:hypothetical protein
VPARLLTTTGVLVAGMLFLPMVLPTSIHQVGENLLLLTAPLGAQAGVGAAGDPRAGAAAARHPAGRAVPATAALPHPARSHSVGVGPRGPQPPRGGGGGSTGDEALLLGFIGGGVGLGVAAPLTITADRRRRRGRDQRAELARQRTAELTGLDGRRAVVLTAWTDYLTDLDARLMLPALDDVTAPASAALLTALTVAGESRAVLDVVDTADLGSYAAAVTALEAAWAQAVTAARAAVSAAPTRRRGPRARWVRSRA